MSEMHNNVLHYNDIEKVLNSTFYKVDKICHPLFKKTPIKVFEYIRFYDSGEILSLGTSPDYTLHEYQNQLLPTLEELRHFSAYGLRATILSHLMPLPPGANEVDPEKYTRSIAHTADHQIYHVFCIIDRLNNYYRICAFAVKESNAAILHFYINAFSVLENFIKYFECQAKSMIEPNDDDSVKLILPYYHQKKCGDKILIDGLENITNIHFSDKSNHIANETIRSISQREKDCLELVGQGYTMKNIAKQLHISPRTVENHLRNIKEKCGINTKNQLVEIWHEYFY
ncbi:MAG: LuxR C-terminal-related transcriptional regulator [Pseudomonadota bacterium]|nr:LuxR C-terminal-related transcriptional regulator [Pseudomonadota bacterium]